jgi:hypothetical protein
MLKNEIIKEYEIKGGLHSEVRTKTFSSIASFGGLVSILEKQIF